MTDFYSRDKAYGSGWSHTSSDYQLHNQAPLNQVVQECLEKQKYSTSLQLADLQMGEQGALQVAHFLKKYNNNFSEIELRGNDITGFGFAEIFDALRGSRSLKKISAEWNNIGSDTLGLISLCQFANANPNLQTIDFRNNNITSKCTDALCNLIIESMNEKSLDLRWNKITDDGGREILNALTKNNKVKVELSGNRISEETLLHITNVLNSIDPKAPTFHSFNPHPLQSVLNNIEIKEPVSAYSANFGRSQGLRGSEKSTPLYENHQQTSSYRSELTSANAINKPNLRIQTPISKENITSSRIGQGQQESFSKDKLEDRNANANLREVIANLENLLEVERKKIGNAETEIEALHGERERRNAENHELRLQCDELTQVLRERTNQFKEACFQIEHVCQQNQSLKNELKKFEEEHIRAVQAFNLKLQELAEKQKRELKELQFDKQSYKFQIEKIKNQCHEQMQDLQDKSEKKYRKFEEELHALSVLNAELSAEVTRQATYIQGQQHKQNDHLRDTLTHVRGEGEKKVQLVKQALEVEFSVVQDKNKQLHQKYLEKVEESELQQKAHREVQAQYIEENHQLKDRIEGLMIEKAKLNGVIMQMTNDLGVKENEIMNLQDDIHNLKKDLHDCRVIQMEEIERVKRDFEFEKKKFVDNEEKLSYKVMRSNQDLDDAKKEIKKLKSEYDRVADVIRGNVSKIITETFLENSSSQILREI